MMDFKSLEQQNNGFGPISKKRKQRSHYAAMAFVLTFLCLASALTSQFGETPLKKVASTNIGIFLGAISALISGELIRRMFLYVEEQYHLDERYLGSRRAALSKCLSFSGNKSIFILWLLTTAGWFCLKFHSLSTHTYMLFMFALPFYDFTVDYFGVKMSAVEISTLSEAHVKNVAVGLAWSYYFGYLKLILPGWNGMLEKAISPDFSLEGEDVRNKLASKKLFIVIPKNCYCYGKFEEADKRISSCSPMPTQYITRGGIQERAYKNMLYCVQLDESPMYVIMEYATPLLSIFDMANISVANFSKDDLNTEVVEFYKTIKMILDCDPECRGKYELVLVSNEQKNLPEIIKDKITETKFDEL